MSGLRGNNDDEGSQGANSHRTHRFPLDWGPLPSRAGRRPLVAGIHRRPKPRPETRANREIGLGHRGCRRRATDLCLGARKDPLQ